MKDAVIHLSQEGAQMLARARVSRLPSQAPKRMQCKNIADRPILEFIQRVENEEVEHTYEHFGSIERFRPTSACCFIGVSYSVSNAMPGVTSEKLVLAKMAKLIKRGVVDGCACGCRGDFTLTDKGRMFLAETKDTK